MSDDCPHCSSSGRVVTSVTVATLGENPRSVLVTRQCTSAGCNLKYAVLKSESGLTPEEQARLMKLVTSNFSWDGVTLTPKYRKPFDLLAEGLLIMDGGANGVAKQNFQSFTQTLDRLPERALNDLYAGLMAA